MSEKLSPEQAKRFARAQFDDALKQLKQAKAVYDQVIDQLPRDASLAMDRWQLEAHLSLTWDYHSQAGQDKFIYETFFRESRDGFFVDIGAHDGVSGSNSLFFERSLGWQGLCIEASPSQFDKLHRNRRTPCLNCAVGDGVGTESFLEIVDGYTQMGGLVSELRGVQLVRENPRHSEKEIVVAVQPLSDILDEQGVTEVDYCSIDVEGAELRVLKGIDFDRHRISVLSIENASHYRTQPNYEIREFMESVGYRYVDAVGYDEIYEKPGTRPG